MIIRTINEWSEESLNSETYFKPFKKYVMKRGNL